MGDELRFEPKSLHSAGQDLGKAGDRLLADWQAMQGTVQGMGELFGDDMVSSLIAATYQAAEQVAHGCYTSAAKGLKDFGSGLVKMAGNYENTEGNTVQDVKSTGKAV
jgi:hypothetical protein